MRRSLSTLVCAAAMLLMLPAAAQAMTFDKAVDKLFRQGYPQRLEKTIAGFKSTPLGFRWTGSPADNQAAQFLADEMTAAGLTNVKLEPVPVDAWSIESAGVTVGGKVMDASSYPGVPPTGADGVTGEVVRIPNYASAADFDKAGDLTGKIALISFASDYWWMNFPCAEAGLRGAKAVILVYDKRYPGYQAAPNAFASNDPGYTYTSPPLVWLPADSAAWLQKQMKKAPVTATVTLRSSHTFAEDGGVGYNVIGELPGSGADGTKIVYGSHHDSHFTGALDNNTVVRRPARHRQGDADERRQAGAARSSSSARPPRSGATPTATTTGWSGSDVLDPAHPPGLGGHGQGHAQPGAARLQEGQHVVHRHARAQAVAARPR